MENCATFSRQNLHLSNIYSNYKTWPFSSFRFILFAKSKHSSEIYTSRISQVLISTIMKLPSSLLLLFNTALAAPAANTSDQWIDLTFHDEITGRTYPFHVTVHGHKINPGPISSPAPVSSAQIALFTPSVYCNIYCGDTLLANLNSSHNYSPLGQRVDLSEIMVLCGV